MQPREQVHPQPEPAAPVAVALGQDPEPLERTDHVLDLHPPPRHRPVHPLLRALEWPASARLVRPERRLVDLPEPLVAGVDHAQRLGRPARAVLAAHPQIVHRARSEGSREDQTRAELDDELGLVRVALLLAAVVAPLPAFFFGRSIGLSIASSATTAIRGPSSSSVSRGVSANRPEPISVSSTRVTMREAVDSCSP